MNIEFKKENGKLFLYYYPENLNKENDWLNDYKIKGTFKIKKEKVEIDLEKEEVKLEIGVLKNEYYLLNKDIFSIKTDIYFFKDIEFEHKYFFLPDCRNNISIIKKIDEINDENSSIYIGGNGDEIIPLEDWKKIIQKFTTSYEVSKYKLSRLELLIGDFLNKKRNYFEEYERYIDKKNKINYNFDLLKNYSEYEIGKWKNILDNLNKMLSDTNKYREGEWEDRILEIILLIFPKYIEYAKKIKIKDPYFDKKSSKSKTADREIYFALLDVDGNIDIFEIKKPEINILKKTEYRNNYQPSKDLIGAIIQAEKYIFYLNKSGANGEKKLNKKFKFNVKITNPQSFIIMGRSPIEERQKRDLEIVKRQYKNVVDIITYDDLIQRIERIIQKFESKK